MLMDTIRNTEYAKTLLGNIEDSTAQLWNIHWLTMTHTFSWTVQTSVQTSLRCQELSECISVWRSRERKQWPLIMFSTPAYMRSVSLFVHSDTDFYADKCLLQKEFVIDHQTGMCRNFKAYCLAANRFWITSPLSPCRISSTMWRIFRTMVW